MFRGFTFYKMANLDNRISNADQLLTQVREIETKNVGGKEMESEGGRERERERERVGVWVCV